MLEPRLFEVLSVTCYVIHSDLHVQVQSTQKRVENNALTWNEKLQL